MPTFVLVHSPLVGPSSWEPVAAVLRGEGHRVEVPSLADAGGPPYYPALAAAIAEATPDGAFLVAHSGAGALLTSAAEAAGRRVAGLVYVGALLPYPGRGGALLIVRCHRGVGVGTDLRGHLAPQGEGALIFRLHPSRR